MIQPIRIYSDIDGVLTAPFKIFDGVRFSKAFSDRDAYAIELLRPWLVFISQDSTNKVWAEHKKVEFVHADCSSSEGKFNALCTHWQSRIGATVPNYIYLGDSLFDWDCLKHARHGFVPNDGSTLLYKKIMETPSIHVLGKCGGHGCLEEFLHLMVTQLWGDLSPLFMPISGMIKTFVE